MSFSDDFFSLLCLNNFSVYCDFFEFCRFSVDILSLFGDYFEFLLILRLFNFLSFLSNLCDFLLISRFFNFLYLYRRDPVSPQISIRDVAALFESRSSNH